MLKNSKILMIGIIVFVSVWIHIAVAATNTPWDGTAWDVTAPGIDELVGNHYKEIYDLRKGIAIRMNYEHATLATASAGGVHKQGAAVCYHQDGIPTLDGDGEEFTTAASAGHLHIDTNHAYADKLFFLDTADGAGTNVWTGIYIAQEAEMVADTHTWAAVQTFNGATQQIESAAPTIVMNDTDSTGDAIASIISFTDSGDAERGFVGYGSGANSHFSISNTLANGDILLAAGGSTRVTVNSDGTVVIPGTTTLGDESLLSTATETADADRAICDLNYVKTGDEVQHDTEGSFKNADYSTDDGGSFTNTKVYTKYIIGTLDGDSETSVPHSIATGSTKILSVTTSVKESGGNMIASSEYVASATLALNVEYDNTNIVFTGVGADRQGQIYRIKIDYIL